MKKQICTTLAAVLLLSNTAFAADSSRNKYSFETGADIEYARHTPTNTIGRNELTENIRRDKDVQVMPPPYFYGDGVFATQTSNPYVYVEPQNYTREGLPTDNLPRYDTLVTGVNYGAEYLGTTSDSRTTEPLEYANGTIGTLKIKSIGLSAKVYEGETLTNLAKGLGHFSYTSAWDGNVGIAGHNGGSAGYFEKLKDVEKGDKIVYTTKYGERTYKVTEIKRIADDDFDDLEDTRDNRLTLITCVRNQSTKRLCVIAEEV